MLCSAGVGNPPASNPSCPPATKAFERSDDVGWVEALGGIKLFETSDGVDCASGVDVVSVEICG